MSAASEPVAIFAALKEAISSGVKLLVILGVIVLDEIALAALLLVVDNILALVQVFLTRAAVTPVANPSLELGTPVTVAGSGDQPPPDAVVARRDVVDAGAVALGGT